MFLHVVQENGNMVHVDTWEVNDSGPFVSREMSVRDWQDIFAPLLLKNCEQVPGNPQVFVEIK